MQPQSIDTLISARWVIPMAPGERVLAQHSVAVHDQRVLAVLPTAEANLQFRAKTNVHLPEHALIPGLINLHTHCAMSLLRGFADDLPLMTWLNDHIWPAEKAHLAADFVYDGTLLAAAEAIQSGTTCVNDMYFYPAATAQALLDAGLRGAVSINVLDFPTPYAKNADDYIRQGLDAFEQYHHEPLLQFTLAPHAPYTVSNPTFESMLKLANELDVQMHCHIHETQAEIQDSLRDHGVRPLARLAQLGLLSPRLIAVHMVHLTEEEIGQLAASGVHIAHNPSSNLKLGSGICPITALCAAGVNVGLGTDGAASNNRLDMFTEMRTAALLAKGICQNPEVIPAYHALGMGTTAGANALARGSQFGTITQGKQADLVAVDLSALACQPCFDPISQLAYVASREHVTHTWVAGRCLLDNRRLTTLDPAALRARATYWHQRLSKPSDRHPT